MPSTFLELGQQLVEDAGISGNITSMVNQTGEFKRVVDWVIRATTEVEGLWFNWDFLHNFYSFNTVVGVSDYAPPSDYNLWDNATAKIVAQNLPLEFVMWTRKKLDVTAPIAGTPYLFTVLPNKSLRFYNTPTSIDQIDIEYWQKPTVLAANLDTPAIPVQFRDIIVYKALQYYANYESADEAKTQALEAYAARLAQLESYASPAQQAKESLSTGMDIQVYVPNDGRGDYY
jgi:hypothetical protein